MREGTERRRQQRSQRKRKFVAMFALFLGMLVLCLPSLISYSPLIHSLLRSQTATYGWTVTANTIRIGWITPLHISQLEAVGASGETVLVADSLDAGFTILDLLRGETDLGTLHLDGPRLETQVYAGGSRLEEDLASWLATPSDGNSYRAALKVRNGTVKLEDTARGRVWRTDQLQMTVQLDQQIGIVLEGVLTDPDGISGTLQTELTYRPLAFAKLAKLANQELATDEEPSELPMEWLAQANGLPLSLLELVTLRFPAAAAGLPQSWSGNASGAFSGTLLSGDSFRCTAQPIDLRNLVVQDDTITGPDAWKVGQARLEGTLNYGADKLACRNFTLVSDAGSLSFDGVLDATAIRRGEYLSAMRGDLVTDFDLAVLTQSAPGLIPVRTDARINSGRVQASISGTLGADQQFRSSWNLVTQPIRATVNESTVQGGAEVVLQPVTAEIILRPVGDWISAEHLHVQSSFGTATASGDLRSGQAQFNLNFGRLASILGSILELPEASLGGTAEGQVRWSVDAQNRWTLAGTAGGRSIVVQLPGGTRLERPRLELVVDAQGVWTAGSLQQLSRASMQVKEPQQAWDFTLVRPVQNPDRNTRLPLRIQGNGQIATLASWCAGSIPQAVQQLAGEIEADLEGNFSLAGGELERLSATVRQASAVVSGRRYEQSIIKTEFQGSLRIPEAELRCQTFTVSGNAVSFAMQGELNSSIANMEIAYRCDLSRLHGSITKPASIMNGLLTGSGTNQIDDAWKFYGAVSGQAMVSRNVHGPWMVALDSNWKDLRVVQPPNIVYASALDGPLRPSATNLQPTEVWAEPKLTIAADLELSPQDNQLTFSSLRLNTPWFATDLAGGIELASDFPLQLAGPSQIDVSVVGQRLTRLLGEPIVARGKHATPLNIRARAGTGGEAEFELAGSIGWDTATVSGLQFGAARVPLRVTENVVYVEPASVPLERGKINLSGEVHYRPGALWFEQQAGLFAEGITLTPEMCRGWLKYMLPLAADATAVSGTFSVELAECLIIPSDPVRSRVRGSLQIEGATVGPGPLAKNLIATIDTLEMAAKGLQGQPSAASDKQWIRLEPQAIDFAMLDGRVSHQRMMMQIGKVGLLSSGNVSLDGRLALGIEVPLQASWLGSELQGLAGQQLTIPINGTLQSPRVDTQAVAGIIGNLGAKAVQGTAENYLQRQLDRQLQKLFGN